MIGFIIACGIMVGAICVEAKVLIDFNKALSENHTDELELAEALKDIKKKEKEKISEVFNAYNNDVMKSIEEELYRHRRI